MSANTIPKFAPPRRQLRLAQLDAQGNSAVIMKRFDFPPELLATLRAAQRVAVLTGAGISAESGVPTFRDAQTGMWSRFKPEDLATPSAFRRNPKLVWEWYAERREKVRLVAPNPGHIALVKLEQCVPAFLLATQNVDGFRP